jgi:general stress protein 26
MKKVFKFKFDDKEGFLSVVEKDNVYYTLVQKDTPKVKSIQESHKLFIAYDLKQPVFHEVDCNVSFDKSLIEAVYKQLEEEKNLYFKQLDDTLCVLEIKK